MRLKNGRNCEKKFTNNYEIANGKSWKKEDEFYQLNLILDEGHITRFRSLSKKFSNRIFLTIVGQTN